MWHPIDIEKVRVGSILNHEYPFLFYLPDDANNCWDYCFGKEDSLATQLVTIVNNQKFDGIDIDYEYCYDIAISQSGKCSQKTASYSDGKAQTFLNTMTSTLRTKLDALQVSNGYVGRYELTHAPMDVDLIPTSAYYQILKARRNDLDFLMPQFYNGITRPVTDGFAASGAGLTSAASVYSSLVNDLFNFEPNKVRFFAPVTRVLFLLHFRMHADAKIAFPFCSKVLTLYLFAHFCVSGMIHYLL